MSAAESWQEMSADRGMGQKQQRSLAKSCDAFSSSFSPGFRLWLILTIVLEENTRNVLSISYLAFNSLRPFHPLFCLIMALTSDQSFYGIIHLHLSEVCWVHLQGPQCFLSLASLPFPGGGGTFGFILKLSANRKKDWAYRAVALAWRQWW